MIENDTWYRCTICGREGLVGRCCGDETREPLNELAIKEQAKIKESQKTIVQQSLSGSEQSSSPKSAEADFAQS